MNTIAYMIAAHADPAHLLRLAGRLSPHADVFIHLDAKSDRSLFAAVEALPNVWFVEDRQSVSWGGDSQSRAILATMRMALGSGREYDKIAFMSGTCYPMADVPAIHEWFMKDPEREFIHWVDMRKSPLLMRVLNKRWFKDPVFHFRNPRLRLLEKSVRFCLAKLNLPNPEPWPEEIVPCFGSSWWVLTGKCCRYILDYVDANPGFRRFYRMTFGSDEHMFHTLVANSSFAAKADGYVEFRHIGTYYLANVHHIDPGLTKWFTLDDWDEIAASGMPFLRKLKSGTSDALCDRLDASPLPIRQP